MLLQDRVHVAIAREQHGEYFDEYRRDYYRLVIALHWAAVRVIAEALLDQRTLSGREARRAMHKRSPVQQMRAQSWVIVSNSA